MSAALAAGTDLVLLWHRSYESESPKKGWMMHDLDRELFMARRDSPKIFRLLRS